MRLAFLILSLQLCCAQPWVIQASGTKVSLRGVSAVSSDVVWASGAEGTWLRTLDGGATWQAAKVKGGETLDFRGIRAFDARRAVMMSSGAGDKSRIYRTTDGGKHWTLLFTNPDQTGFFDAIAFWDAEHGIIGGDAVGNHMAILTTDDGGDHWVRQDGPEALAEEGAFAASNSCVALQGNREAWFATGGTGAARVFYSQDRGRHWSAATTPVRNDSATAGIFSLAFRDSRHGVAVGGNFKDDREARRNIAVTSDGGRTWITPRGAPPAGYRSAVLSLLKRQAWIATGTTGSDISFDDGRSWKKFDDGPFNALAAGPGDAAWAVGPEGRIARLKTER
jgi:photosystem II stability/assembly factor-like uncharacterized protein